MILVNEHIGHVHVVILSCCQFLTSGNGRVNGLGAFLKKDFSDTSSHGLVNGRGIHDQVVLAQALQETILSKVHALDMLRSREHGHNDGSLLGNLQRALGDFDLVLVVGISVVISEEVRGGRLVDVIDNKVGLVLESVKEVGGHGEAHVAESHESNPLDFGLQ